MSTEPIRVTVWGENRHEQIDEKVRDIYPDGMHEAIAAGLRRSLGDGVTVGTHTLDEPEHGLTEQVLADTDVLLWWGHVAHEEVEDEVVERVHHAALEGMGILVLHSAHHSKIFRRLMGTTCALRWRNDGGDRELVWTTDPRHPIARGVPQPIVVPRQEMYGEFFDIPHPEEQVFISSFTGGEVFRSGVTYTRGYGKVFYFSPGDEQHPVYHQPEIQQVLANGVEWASPTVQRPSPAGAPNAARDGLTTPNYARGSFDRPLRWDEDAGSLVDWYTGERAR